MISNEQIQSLPLGSIAQRCAEESDHFFNQRDHDPRFCYEMFRRAIFKRNERAWQLVCRQYRPLVAGWVERHRAYRSSGEEVQYFVNGAFAKMWSAFSPEKFGSFPNLKSLLSYLKLCVSSVVTDYVRSADYYELLEDAPAGADEAGSINVEKQALNRARRSDFWRTVNDRLNDERERLVVYYSYVMDLKPSQICEHKPEQFPDVREIYRIKENVLSRFRRDTALQEILSDHA